MSTFVGSVTTSSQSSMLILQILRVRFKVFSYTNNNRMYGNVHLDGRLPSLVQQMPTLLDQELIPYRYWYCSSCWWGNDTS